MQSVSKASGDGEGTGCPGLYASGTVWGRPLLWTARDGTVLDGSPHGTSGAPRHNDKRAYLN